VRLTLTLARELVLVLDKLVKPLLLLLLPELPDVLIATVVAPLTTTIVVPEITVVCPDTEKLGFTGIVVGPNITRFDVPEITVCPGFTACTLVEDAITRNGVPFNVVVEP